MTALVSTALADAYVTAVGLVTVVVGLAVSAVAFRGARRNRSRPMLFLALGISALTWLGVLVNLAVDRLTSPIVVGMSDTTMTLVGVLCLGCSLYLLRRD